MSDTFDHFDDAIDQYLGGAPCDWSDSSSEIHHHRGRDLQDVIEWEKSIWKSKVKVTITKEQFENGLKFKEIAYKRHYDRGWIWHKLNDMYGEEIANTTYYLVQWLDLEDWDSVPTKYKHIRIVQFVEKE